MVVIMPAIACSRMRQWIINLVGIRPQLLVHGSSNAKLPATDCIEIPCFPRFYIFKHLGGYEAFCDGRL